MVDYIATSACMESSHPGTDWNMLHIMSNDTDTPDKVVALDATTRYCRMILLSRLRRGTSRGLKPEIQP